jgi:predicted nuclease of predicted toxin-antitoxin system
MGNEKRFAVLIDADNISDKYVKLIFDEVSNDGVVTYKRIYGDWTKPNLASWKNILLDFSITPIQQYGYTTGKNSTDSAMIIDAMDILYTKNVEGFCLVTSDSDFTRLASRLRESGMFLIGMGEKKTPKPFISACNQFKYLDLLAESLAEEGIVLKTPDVNTNTSNKNSEAVFPDKAGIVTEVKRIIEEISDDDGWAFLGDIGNVINKRYPDFDTRNYGFKKLTPFLSQTKEFEIESRNSKGSNVKLYFVKLK